MKTVVKMGILIGIWIAWTVVGSTIDPIVANQLAMSQMGNTADSSLWIQLYTLARNYEVLWFGVLTVFIFVKEICLAMEILIEEMTK